MQLSIEILGEDKDEKTQLFETLLRIDMATMSKKSIASFLRAISDELDGPVKSTGPIHRSPSPYIPPTSPNVTPWAPGVKPIATYEQRNTGTARSAVQD